jgi:Skp family chaperone for outer membrane proteins
MKTKTRWLSLAVSLFVVTLFAPPTFADDTKIATVNFEQLLEQSPELSTAMLNLRNRSRDAAMQMGIHTLTATIQAYARTDRLDGSILATL